MQAARTMSGVEVSAWGAVQNWRTWYLAVINLCDSTVKYAIIYWCPLIIYHMVGENMPHTAGEAVVPHDALVALLTALPFGFAAVFMLVNARHSAATGQLHFCNINCTLGAMHVCWISLNMTALGLHVDMEMQPVTLHYSILPIVIVLEFQVHYDCLYQEAEECIRLTGRKTSLLFPIS